MANGFDLITRGLKGAIDGLSANSDQDLADEHILRRSIASNIIVDRNKANLLSSKHKLQNDIATRMENVNWLDPFSVEGAKSAIFGDEGSIRNAQTDYLEYQYTPIPDSTNEMQSIALEYFRDQTRVSADAWIETERARVTEARNTLLTQTTATIFQDATNVDGIKAHGSDGSSESISDVQSHVIDLFEQVDTALEIVNQEVTISPVGTHQEQIFTAPTVGLAREFQMKASVIDAVFTSLLTQGREIDAINLYESLLSDQEGGDKDYSPVKGLHEVLVGPNQIPLYFHLQEKVKIQFSEDLTENDQLRVSLTNRKNEISEQLKSVKIFPGAQLKPEIQERVDNLERELYRMEEGYQRDIKKLININGRININSDQDAIDDRLRTNLERFRNSEAYAAMGFSQESIGTSDNTGELSDLIKTFTDLHVGESPLSPILAALDVYTGEDSSSGLKERDISGLVTIIKNLEKNTDNGLGDQLFRRLKEIESNPNFLAPLFEEEGARFRETITRAGSANQFLDIWEKGSEEHRAEQGGLAKEVIGFFDDDMNGIADAELTLGAHFNSESKAELPRSGQNVAPSGPGTSSMIALTGAIRERFPRTSILQASEHALRRSTNSSALGFVPNTNGADPDLIDFVVAGVLASQGAFGFGLENSSMETHDSLSRVAVVPLGAIELDRPESQTFRIIDRDTGRPMRNRDGEPIITDFDGLINKDSINTVEDLTVALNSSSMSDVVLGSDLDKTLVLSRYQGGEVSMFTRFSEIIPVFSGKSIMFDQKFDDSQNVDFLREYSTEQDDSSIPPLASLSGQSQSNTLGRTTWGEVLYNPSEEARRKIEKSFGSKGLEHLDRLSTNANHVSSVGNPRNISEVIAYEFRNFIEELAVRTYINDNDVTEIDLEDWSGSPELISALEEDPRFKPLVEAALKDFNAGELQGAFFGVSGGDRGTPIHKIDDILHSMLQGATSAKESALNYVDSALRGNALIPDNPRPTGSDLEPILHSEDPSAVMGFLHPNKDETKKKVMPKADKAVFDSIIINEKIKFVQDDNTKQTWGLSETIDIEPDQTVTYVRQPDEGLEESFQTVGEKNSSNLYNVVNAVAEGQPSMIYDYKDLQIRVTGVYDGDTIYIEGKNQYMITQESSRNNARVDGARKEDFSIRFPFIDAPEVANVHKGTFG